uniref:Uncharacterized protein n=1 Tax=Arion vulgaris TaxID=1028688 RepID=A0A0B6Z8T1_9EUPU
MVQCEREGNYQSNSDKNQLYDVSVSYSIQSSKDSVDNGYSSRYDNSQCWIHVQNYGNGST